MERKKRRKRFVPVILLFLVLNVFFLNGRILLDRWGANRDVLLVGNAFLFIITLLSFFIARRGLANPNPHAFVRSFYSSILIKLFVCLIVAAVYLFVTRTQMNKPAFFTLMGLYLVYTFMEVSLLTKILKQNANA